MKRPIFPPLGRSRMGFFFAIAALGCLNGILFAQTSEINANSDRNAVLAREQFRLGVQAFNRFAYNESILSFEKALSYRPSEALILEWLGRAYYRSGLEDTALRQWRSALEYYKSTSDQGLLLSSMIETVGNRRSLFPVLDDTSRYVDAGTYPSVNGTTVLYRQPTSVLSDRDGSVWVVAYGSNELVRIDPNGIIRERLRGPINGFDRPFDIARGIDGRLYVSEYRGGRVSVLDPQGQWKAYIGSKGRGDGMFVGPQNLAVDDQGYLYVVDFGNLRISKFSPQGDFLFSFGTKSDTFSGFRAPTGIAPRGNDVFVADEALKKIFRFDRSGNYLGVAVDGGLNGPESLKTMEDGRILVADTNRVVVADPDTALVKELGLFSKAGSRLTGAVLDANGNIVAANFQAGEVDLLARMDDLSAGLFVQISRVISDKFPDITVEVEVQDRRRRPIVGLEGRNFVLTEKGTQVAEQAFLGASYLSTESNLSVVIERSPQTIDLATDQGTALRDTAASTDRLVSVVSAFEQPVKERIDGPKNLALAARGNTAAYTPAWRFDLALRLAASDLLAQGKKRGVVFIGSGRLGQKAFTRYGLTELADYLANNGIKFYAVILGNGSVDKELTYLCQQTGGQVLSVYRNEGIGPVLKELRTEPSGTYALRYRSSLPTDFGRAYLPVEAEVYLLNRSGRDSTGYFPPLE